jgi:hypothetical protein
MGDLGHRVFNQGGMSGFEWRVASPTFQADYQTLGFVSFFRVCKDYQTLWFVSFFEVVYAALRTVAF